ncbi:Exopolyphosphatase [Cryptotrichosporon argae]
MRLCVPLALDRISASAHRAFACNATNHASRLYAYPSAMSNVQEGKLAGFLRSQKDEFLVDLERGNVRGWTVAMGNEAGDLDSLASSIAFAYLSTALAATRSVPLVLTPSSLMHLRPENLLAFRAASVDPSALLYPDLLPASSPASPLGELGAHFALVDHNRLLPGFSGPVDAVIDHHDDEHAHADAAVRLVRVPTGSCASLVTAHFRPAWAASLAGPAGAPGSPVPSELATLLLSAILIDTQGLKAGGKATATDVDAAQFLYPLSTLHDPAHAFVAAPSAALAGAGVPPALEQFTADLVQTKYCVDDLSTADLLIRDYKQYTWPTAAGAALELEAGLSTVPLGLKPWLLRDGGWPRFWPALDGFMRERRLDVAGVLTTFKSKKGKSRRELAMFVRAGHSLPDLARAHDVLDAMSRGVEGSGDVLGLEDWGTKDGEETAGKKALLADAIRDQPVYDGRIVGRVWQQTNTKSTRKQVAPILRDTVAAMH